MMETRENHEAGIFFLVEINARKSWFSLNSFLRSISEKLLFFFSIRNNTHKSEEHNIFNEENHSLCVLHTHALHALSARTARNSLVAGVKFASRARFESGSKYFSIFFSFGFSIFFVTE